MEKTLKAAIIGSGNIASTFDRLNPGWTSTHAGAYNKSKEIELVAFCDIDISKAKAAAQEWNIQGYYSSVEDMIKQEKPDIVSICTPNESHARLVKICAQSGVRGIYCEKPISTSIKEAREMLDACKNGKVKLLIGHQRRYDQFYNSLKEEMDKILGKVKMAVFFYCGGVGTTGSHMFDLLRFLFGDVETVQMQTCDHGKAEPDVSGTLTLRSGLKVSILSTDNSDFSIFELDIIGSKGRLDVINKPFGDYETRFYPVEKSTILDNARFIGGSMSKPFRKHFDRDFMENAVNDLAHAIIETREPISSGEDGYKALEIILACLESAREGKIVHLPYEGNISVDAKGGVFRKWQKS